MKTQRLTTGLAALLGLGLSMSALADEPIALLDQIQGTVLTNQGKDLVTARPGMQLYPGDHILVMEGAKAAVVYQDQCVLDLGSNSLLTLGSAKECTLNTAQVQTVGIQYAQAGLGAAPATGAGIGTEAGAGITSTILSGVAVSTTLGAIAAMAVESGGSNNKITICHFPPGNPDNPQTITINLNALRAHLAHGDFIGTCEGDVTPN